MDSKLLKKVIAIVVIGIIIIIAILIGVLQIGYKDDRNNIKNIFVDGDVGEEVNYERYTVTDKTEYYTVRDCVNTYLQALNKESDLFSEESLRKEFAYNLLSKEYISSNRITSDTVFDRLLLYDDLVKFTPLEMDVLEQDITSKFVTYGIVMDMDDRYVGDLYVVVTLDYENKTFSIEPMGRNYSSIKDINITNEDEQIAVNEYNQYEMPSVNDRYVSNEYMELFTKLAIAKPEKLYDMLEAEYIENRFLTLDDFKEFIEYNSKYIPYMICEKYMVNRYDDYTDYIVTDHYGHIFTFREYKEHYVRVLLDDYTLETDLYKANYKKASDMDKSVSNVSRFFEMINIQDYKSAYNLLDDNFKTTYFPTLADFINYAKTKFYLYNSINYDTYNNEIQGIHVLKITIKDATKASASEQEGKSFNIIIKLLEDTNFVMSFSENV